MCGMEFELEETLLQFVASSDGISSSDRQRLIQIFDQANRRLNAFLPNKMLAYQKYEMAVTFFPVGSFIIARVGNEIAGYASFFDNYLIGIFISDHFSDGLLGQRLLAEVKQTLNGELETTVFLKNSSLLELYLENGFQITACRSCGRTKEIKVSLVHDGPETPDGVTSGACM